MTPARFFTAITATFFLCVFTFAGRVSAEDRPPNFVVIFADDLGYGDLSCFGHPTIRTPNLDRMAAEGQKWTNFYVAACVCTPSRAGLLTGRYPVRNGMASDKKRVLFPESTGGLPQSEITIARMLKQKDYATAAVGKWHLGHLPEFLPTSHGFDSFFGIPYSNDMDRVASKGKHRDLILNPKVEYFNVPLMRNEEIVERPADQTTITRRYTEEAVSFIKKEKDHPFFLYLAHSMPHVPLFRSPEFEGVSDRGFYGDVIEEVDWSVGQVLNALRKEGLAENTLVVFTSDNGPWLLFDQQGGSAGLLRDGKGSAWEGGMREPTIFWWPGKLKQGPVHDMGSTLDLLPTFAALSGAQKPEDRVLDGYDISPALLGTGPSPRQEMYYHQDVELYAVRSGWYKCYFKTMTSYIGQKEPDVHDPPLLFDLGSDPSEKYDIAAEHPDIIAKMRELAKKHLDSLKPVENQLEKHVTN